MNIEDRRCCVYAVQGEATGRVYIGQTDLLQRRLGEHNKGRVKSTKRGTPWKLVAREYFEDRLDARWAESIFKRSKGMRLKWLAKNKVRRAYASEINIPIEYQNRIADVSKKFMEIKKF